MISSELARALRTAGLRWHPGAGDRFMIDGGEFRGEIFTVSEMTIEVHEQPGGGRTFGFNGTTEWALDSVDERDTLWLPREDQLRTLLRGSFRSLEQVAPDSGDELDFADDERYDVVTVSGGAEQRFSAATAADAYAEALLHLILRSAE